jgi:hypothetical protein
MDHHDIKECCKNVDTHERCIHFELGCECEFNPDDKCQSQAFIDNTKILNYIFNFVFCCELILKVLGMGFKAYISVTFNQLDFFIVVTSVLDMVGELTRKEGEQGSMGIFKLFRVFRLFRVLRVARFLYKNKNLKRILKTVFGSGAALGNLGLFISFSIMLFALLECTSLEATIIQITPKWLTRRGFLPLVLVPIQTETITATMILGMSQATRRGRIVLLTTLALSSVAWQATRTSQ